MPTTILNPGDPRLNGASGPDSFTAPSGNSGINGFGGIDTVTFSFNLVDATVSYHDNVVWIDTATSHTELTGIQTYIFNDGTVSEADGDPLVADLYYYSTYHDIWTAHADADLHYAASGWVEHRNPSAFFDTDLYLSINQDVLASGVNPLVQFDTVGWTQGRQPSANFDVQKYLATYPDVAAANIDPLAHFLLSGVEEGRVPFPVATITNNFGFDALYYLQTYADVKAAHIDPYQHFLTSGWQEGRNPNAYFDTLGYLATYTDVAAAGVNPLIHFDSGGWHEGRIPSPGFDTAAYLAAYPDVAAAGVDPLAHFLKYGINEGRVAFAKPIFDTNGAANIVLEGAAAGTNSGLSVSWGAWISPALSFSLGSDSSGGGFAINNLTGAVTVADSTKLDFETSGASHSYVITVVAHDGALSSSQTFTINIGDVVPTTPIDGNAAANTVVEGAANGATVGVTLFSDEPNGPPVVYQLTDNAGGRFAVDSSTGVVTVANSALLDFESGAHSFVITGRTQVGAVFTATQNFTINLTNAAPSPISDSNAASETVNEGAAVNTLVGIDADSTDPLGPAVIWSITSDSSGGGFKIDANGVVSVANAALIDYEDAPDAGHSYSIIVQASDGVGGTTSRNFSIVVNNVNPTTPVDTSGAAGGNVTEGAAVDTLVGIDADSSDINGPPVTWSIAADTSGGGFKIDANGVVSVANAALINYEPATHSYDVTVQASDGFGTSSQTFNIVVANVAPTTPTEVADGTAGGSVSEGASNGALVGITAASTDVNGPAVIWSITSDSSNLGSGGAFTINSSGVVSVGDATKLNYETAPGAGRSYDITIQASDGFNASSQNFNILVGNVNPTTPTDGDPTNDAAGIQGQIVEGATAGTPVGIDANALDPNGPAVTWSILSGSASGGFQIDLNSGIVSVLNGALLNYENAPSVGVGQVGHTILVQASDGQGGTSTQTFTIELTNEAPAAPTDTDLVGDGAGTIKGIATEDATEGTLVGIHAQSAGDPAGGTVTYELAAGSSTFFQINASTGEVSVSADGVGDLVEGTNYDIFVVAKDSTGLASGTSSPPAQFTIRVPAPGVAAPQDADGTTNGGLNQIAEDAVGTPGNFGLSAYTGVQAQSPTATSYSISTDTSGGGFQIDPTDGKIYVANGALIDFESAPSNKYTVTVVASDSVTGTTASTNFDVTVLDVAPTTPIDDDPSAGVLTDPAAGRVALSAANGSNVGITVSSSDIDGGALTYELTSNPGNRFAINATTGVVTLADNSGLVAGTPLNFSARAVSTNGGAGTDVSAAQAFIVDVVSNQPIVDLNGLGSGGNAGTDFSNSFAEGPTAAAITDTDAAINYPGFTNLTSATITLTNAQVGDALAVVNNAGLTVNTVSGGGKITVTLTGNAAFSVYETALRSITFENTNNTPVTGARTITVVVSDGVNPPSNAATSTITVSATNDAPTLNLTLPDLTTTTPYQENAAPLALATAGSVTDPDAPVNFNGGRYTVEITNDSVGDQIVLLASSGFSAAGSSIIYGGVEIGTILAGTALGTAEVTIVLDADATPVVVNALSKAFAYRSILENPADGALNDRTIDFTFQDGGNTGAAAPGASSNTVTQTVRVTAVNDAPVNLVPSAQVTLQNTLLNPSTLTFAPFTNGITFFDADLEGGELNVTLTVLNGTLTLNGTSGLTFTTGPLHTDEPAPNPNNDGTGDASLSFRGSRADIEAALDGLIYTPNTGFTGSDTLTVVSDDFGNTGTGGPLTDTDIIPITVSATAILLDLDADNSGAPGTSFKVVKTDAAAVAVADTDVTITDPASTNITSATITLTNAVAGDSLAINGALPGSMTSTIDTDVPGIITVTLSGTDTLANYQTAINQVEFNTSSGNANDRHLTVVVHDDTAAAPSLFATPAPVYSVGTDPRLVTLGDLNSDGVLDLVSANNGGDSVSVRLGNGNGTFGAASTISMGAASAPTSVALGDVDGDGKLDLAVTKTGSGAVSVLLGNGAGGFAPATDYTVGTTPYAVAAADLNGDGKLDLVTANYGSNNISVLIGDGAGGFAAATPFSVDVNPTSVAVGDFDGDGDFDLAVANNGAATTDDLSILFNNGSGSFSGLANYSTGTLARTVAVGDMNADGRLDLAVTNEGTDDVSVLLGGALGVFGAATNFTVGDGPTSVVIGDVNGDGKADLAVSNYSTSNVSVLAGDGVGSFGSATNFAVGTNPYSLAIGDLNGITGLDLVVANGTSSDVSVLLNNSTNTSNTAQSTVSFPTNAAPTLDLDTATGTDNFTTSYQIGDPAVAVTGTVDIVDVDNTTIESATVTLTNAQVGDALAINGALPVGIAAAIVAVDNADPTPDTITVTLTGPASQAAFETALHQVVFTSSSSVTATPRVIDIAVDDGTPQSSNVAQTTISLTGNTPPVAWDDAASATEASGLNNATAGSNPSGNVFADNNPLVDADGDTNLTNDVDFDAEDAPLPTGAVGGSVVVVTQVTHGLTTVSAGTTIIGTYGAVTINANGSYSYSIDQSNAAVQALVSGGSVLNDVFTYTIRDAFGATDTADLDITINGADDTALASADTGSMGEDTVGAVSFNVRANDTLDPDTGAGNTITLLPGATAAGNAPANGLGIGIEDVTLSVNGSNQILVTLSGSDFQKLKVGDTATITVPYRLAGDTQNSDSSLTITVNGANDLPVANDDTGSMSEDDATTPFTVLTGPGADVLDVDRTAPTAATAGAVTTGTVTAVGNGTASGKGIDGADVTVGVNASNQITVSLGADFHKLSAGETATVTVAYLLHGDGADTDGANLTVTVNGLNDAPVVDLLSTAGLQTTGITSTFTENGPVPPSVPVNVLPQVTLSDVDGGTLTGAIVTLTNAQVGVDILTLQGIGTTSGTLANGIGYAITSNNTVVTFSNVDSLSDYQDALRLIQFNNASDNPTQTDRTFTVQINDGAATNAATTATLDFVAINDAPVNTTPNNLNPMSDTDFAVAGLSVADADAGAGLIRTTLSATNGDLTVTLGGATVFTGANGSHTVGLQGTVAQINSALASLKYNSDAGYTGLDSISVQTSDQGNSPAPAQSDTDSITLGVIPKVWIIDNSVAGSGGDGSAGNPFRSIAEFNAATTGASTNEYVLLKTGTGTYAVTDGIHLKDGMELVGGGDGLSFVNPIAGQPVIVFNPTGGTRPTIQVSTGAGDDTGIDLAQNNKVHGLNVATVDGTAIGIDDGVANNSVGNLQVSNMQITGAGKAIDIDHGGALTVTLDKLTSTGSSTEGIDLGGNVTGNVTINDNTSTISGAGGTDFNITTSGLLNVTFNGNITQNSNAALVSVSGGHTGTVTFQNGTLTGADGTGLVFNNADGTYNFNGTNTLSNGDGVASSNAGISITNGSGGNFSFSSNSSIVNQTSGTAFNLDGGNGTITYAGTIGTTTASSDNSGSLSVSIANRTGGTVTFSGNILDSNDAGGGIFVNANSTGTNTINFTGASQTFDTGASAGVNLTTNTGATINFNPAGGGNGLDITTTTGVGFNATGGGTVVVTDPDGVGGVANTISSGTGTALNVSGGTTIGGSGLTFQSISSSGAASGIILNNTGTAAGNGGLTVTGTGTTDGTGGTIANSTGTGISLTSTKAVNLTNINVSGSADDGINGASVNGFTLTNVNITNNGNAVGDEGIQLTQLSGSGGIADSVISGSRENQITITNDTANLTGFNVTNTTISTTNFTTGDDGFRVLNTGSAAMTVSVTGSTFTDNKGDHFQAATDADATGTMNITFNNNTLTTTAGNDPNVLGGGITINTSGSLDIVFQINNNNIQQAFDDAININLDPGSLPGASMIGTINGNTIGTSGVAASGSESSNTVTVAAKGAGLIDIDIMNNQIFEWGNQYGIFLGISERSALGDPDMVAKVTGNTLHATFPNALLINGIRVDAGATANGGAIPADSGTLEVVLTGNDVTGEGFAANGDADIRLRQRFATTIKLPGYGGANNDTAAVNAFVAANNDPAGATPAPTVSSAQNVAGGGGGFIGGAATPLRAGFGGVESTLPTLAEMQLSQSQLDATVSAGLLWWLAAGASAQQLAQLQAVNYSVTDLSGRSLGQQNLGTVQIDVDAAGHGWFVDATPFDSLEFANASNAGIMQFFADPTQAPAGHMDLLTAVLHEMGHVLGLAHNESDPGDVMSDELVTGERRLPDSQDVADATASTPQPVAAGEYAADTFVITSAALAAPIQVADYSAAQGDTFDFSGLQIADAAKVRVVEDASDAFALLQVDIGAGGTVTRGAAPASHWVNVAQVDGVHAGDAVDVWLNPAQVAHLHAGLLG